MARPKKRGFDFFPIDTKFDIEVEALMASKGGTGLALWVLCLQNVYANGWYFEWDKMREIFISGKIGVSPEETRVILEVLFDLGLFDRDKFNKYSVITGHGVQSRYLNLCSISKKIPEKHGLFWINPELMGVISGETAVIPENSTQSKEEKSKEKEKKESKETPPEQIDPNSLTREKNLQTFHHFWEAYDKKNGKEKTFEAWITLSLEDQRKALKGAKIYKENEPDSQFRSNPERYLTGKEWMDEKATKKKQPKKDKFPRASLGIDRPFCEPKEVTS